jgi:translocation and assembly module TamB
MSEAPAAPPEAPRVATGAAPCRLACAHPARAAGGRLRAAHRGAGADRLAGATQSGLARLVDLAAQLSGGVVGIERPEGYLLGQLKLGALHVRTPTLQVDVVDLPRLAPRRLRQPRARRGAADRRRRPGGHRPERRAHRDAGQPRASCRGACGRFQIDRLRVGKLIAGQPAAPDLELTGIAGSLDSDGRSHRLDELRLSAPFGQLAGQLDLDGRKPFPLVAQAVLTTRQAGEPYTVAAGAAGDLESWCSTPASAAPASTAGR